MYIRAARHRAYRNGDEEWFFRKTWTDCVCSKPHTHTHTSLVVECSVPRTQTWTRANTKTLSITYFLRTYMCGPLWTRTNEIHRCGDCVCVCCVFVCVFYTEYEMHAVATSLTYCVIWYDHIRMLERATPAIVEYEQKSSRTHTNNALSYTH